MHNWSPQVGAPLTVDLNFMTEEEAKDLRFRWGRKAHYAQVLVKATMVDRQFHTWKFDSLRYRVQFETGDTEWVHPHAVSEPREMYQPDMSMVHVVLGATKTPPAPSLEGGRVHFFKNSYSELTVSSANKTDTPASSKNDMTNHLDAVLTRQRKAAKELFGNPQPDTAK